MRSTIFGNIHSPHVGPSDTNNSRGNIEAKPGNYLKQILEVQFEDLKAPMTAEEKFSDALYYPIKSAQT